MDDDTIVNGLSSLVVTWLRSPIVSPVIISQLADAQERRECMLLALLLAVQLRVCDRYRLETLCHSRWNGSEYIGLTSNRHTIAEYSSSGSWCSHAREIGCEQLLCLHAHHAQRLVE